jgi:NAD(P)-dependent dehydrogenase (short-subunit alcohol dehydrogenase family)
MAELSGKVAIVTGGASGIGEATSRMLVERGARVCIADMNEEAATGLASSLGEDKAFGFTVDVSDPAQVKAMVDATVDRFGALHIGVNNAGIGGKQGFTADYEPEDWHKVISVNLDGVFYSMRYQIPEMLKTGNASIVNIASILGSVGFASAPAYVAAKHGVVGLTKTAAWEYAQQGVRVNSVGPGFIDTPLLASVDQDIIAGIAGMHASNRLGTSEEVAELITFLASDRASNMTGGYYLTDGGYTAR